MSRASSQVAASTARQTLLRPPTGDQPGATAPHIRRKVRAMYSAIRRLRAKRVKRASPWSNSSQSSSSSASLAAIAIPVSLNQRSKGWDSAVKATISPRNGAGDVSDRAGVYSALRPDASGSAVGGRRIRYSTPSNYDNGTAGQRDRRTATRVTASRRVGRLARPSANSPGWTG